MTIRKASDNSIVGAVETLNFTGQKTGSRSLPSGAYTVTVNATDNSNVTKMLYFEEILYVYANLTSSFTQTFTDANFSNTKWLVTVDQNYTGKPANTTQVVAHGGSYTAPAAPTRTGYTFSKWTTAANGTGTSCAAGGTVTVIDNITLYAQWTIDCFMINNEADLRKVGTGTDGWTASSNYMLNADITLTSNWTPIGSFTGSLDGAGHTIKNMTIPSGTTVGMFTELGSGGVVKNLRLENVQMTSSGDIGAIAANLRGTIENCSASGSITSTGSSSSAGGLTGYTYGVSMVKNSYFNGTVSGSHAGGIAGFIDGPVQNCYAAGTVTGTGASYGYSGGIVGRTQSGSIKYCVALSNLIAPAGKTPKRIVANGPAPTNSHARSDLTIQIGTAAPITRTSTNENSADGADVTPATLSTQAFWETIPGWDFTTVWQMSGGVPVLQAP
jgi:uncharacterized repeat protein (TIGR02543 family)